MAVDPNELYDQLMRQNTAEQDIQAIAKQISDHAEAIYQTWKSKGLTPNELLHLHSGVKNKHSTAAASDATTQSQSGQTSSTMSGAPFRQQQQQQVAAGGRNVPAQSSARSSATPERRKSSSSLSPVELLASPQLEATLEQLVNSFVQEDKARLASTRGRTASPAPSSPSPCATSSSSSSPLSSSSSAPAGLHPAAAAAAAHPSASPIQTALKRFEKRGLNYESTASRPVNASTTATIVPVTGANGRHQSPAPTTGAGIRGSAAAKNSPTTFQEAMQSASIAVGRTSSTPSSVSSQPLAETSSDTVKSRAQRFVSRVEMANAPLSSSSPSPTAASSGNWPVAKRATTPTPTAAAPTAKTRSSISTMTTTTTTTTIQQQQQQQQQQTQTVLTEVVHFVGADSTTAQVDKEEQKLINALKTGQIINNNDEGISSSGTSFAPMAKDSSSSTAPEQFLMSVKKTKERQLQEHQLQQQQRSAARTVTSAEAKAEAELETLVDRLKCIDNSSMSDGGSAAVPSVASSSSTGAIGGAPTSSQSLRASRESSPALTMLGPQYQRDSASPARSSSPRCFKLSETVPIAGVSNVDYAKVRYQAAQANPLTQQRLEDSRTIGKAQNAPQPNVVSETRSRFEGATAAAAAGRGLQTANSSPVPWRANSLERVIGTTTATATTTNTTNTSECWSPVRPPGQQQSAENDQTDSATLHKFPSTSVGEGNQQQSMAAGSTNGSGGLNLDALRRIKGSRKLRKSPEPQASQSVAGGSGGGGSSGNSNTSSPTSSPLPHPELTLQQRQHLRERNLQQLQQQQQHGASASGSGSGGIQIQYTSSGVPIRPFLTRGSVAERVLIFEKCPTALGHGSSSDGGSNHAARLERAHPSVGGGSASGDAASGSSSSPSSSAAAAAALMEKTAKRAGSPAPHALAWRVHSSNDVHNRTQGYAKDKENNKENRSTSPSISSPRSTLRRQAKSNNNLLVPRFYYPTGRPSSKEQSEGSMQRVAAIFQQLPNGQASREHFGTIAKACSCPFYWKSILFIASGGEKLGHISLDTFVDFWKKIITNYHDEASRFVHLLTLINPNGNSGGQYGGRMDNGFSVTSNGVGRSHLVPEDFVPLVQDVVDTHPGLTFLKEAAEFHSRYVHTVIARIFYNVNRSWSGHITLAELRHSNLLSTVRLLEEEEDINQITDYFSYEHFYVIYCKFWELDKDHDLFIDKKDLARHNDHALSSKMIDRIFSGAVTRGSSHSSKLAQAKLTPVANSNNINMNNQPRMSYTEFVWFLISEEDKRHPTAIEYWFRCMDLDGDGYLSMYELEYFYEEQLQRMESLGIETLPFEDCLCQMLDMIHPAVPGKVSLNDLKRCQMTPIFFDTFFNLEKYLDHEQRDPFASQRDPDSENGDELLKISDWDRYAAEEYELLVAEEGSPDHNEDMFMREEMAATEEEEHASVPMERDVIMSETDMPNDHYDSLTVHPLGSNHRSLFSVTPCSIEYQY